MINAQEWKSKTFNHEGQEGTQRRSWKPNTPTGRRATGVPSSTGRWSATKTTE